MQNSPIYFAPGQLPFNVELIYQDAVCESNFEGLS